MQTEHHLSNTGLSAPRFRQSQNVARTMSSREIAAVTGKRHDNVKRDIAAMLKDLELDALSFEGIYLDGLNREQTEYLLDEEHTLCLTSGYDANQRMAIIREWKAKQAPKVLSQLEVARQLVDSLERNEAQAQQLAIAAPKAAFVDQYVEAAGTFSFRQVAKTIGANERQFRQMLLDSNAMYYLGGVLTPASQHITAGRFEVKTGTSDHNGHAFTQARFTAKGVEWVASKWAQYGAAGGAQ